MRRRFFSIVALSLVITLCITACGKSEEVPENTTASQPAQTESVTTTPTATADKPADGSIKNPSGGSFKTVTAGDQAPITSQTATPTTAAGPACGGEESTTPSVTQTPSGTGNTQPTGSVTPGPTQTPSETGTTPAVTPGVTDDSWRKQMLTYTVDKDEWIIHKTNCPMINIEHDFETVRSTLNGLISKNNLGVCPTCLGEGKTHCEEDWELHILKYTVDMDSCLIHKPGCSHIVTEHDIRYDVKSTIKVLETKNYLFRCPYCLGDLNDNQATPTDAASPSEPTATAPPAG